MDSIVLGLIFIILLCIYTSAFQSTFHYFWQNFDFAGLVESLEPILDIFHDFVGDRRILSPHNRLDIKRIKSAIPIDFSTEFRVYAPTIFWIAMLPVIKTWLLDVLPVIVDFFECLPRLKAFIL